MKITSKTKILFAIIVVIALAGPSLFKKSRPMKPLLSNQSTADTSVIQDQKTGIGGVDTVEKLLLSDLKTTNYTEESFLDDPIGPLLGDLPLPSASLLSMEEQERAIASFAWQHNSWLAIRDGSARYKMTVRPIKEGKIVEIRLPSQTGKIEFLVTPLDKPVGRQSPAKVQTRIFNDRSKWNLVQENVFDAEAPSWQWVDDSAFDIDSGIDRQSKNAFPSQLLFFPLDFMAKTYSDESWDSKYTMDSRDEYFAGRGCPRRKSTPEETEQIFGGEPQYLFLASPGVIDAHYWFSAESGELRQIDVFSPRRYIFKSFRYENYVQKEGQNVGFPQRFILTSKRGYGGKARGWEYTIELSDVKLNTGISPERFIPDPNVDY